ncbi:MAG: hypothetical protein AAF419_03925 [Pseudomonadota bacterium]
MSETIVSQLKEYATVIADDLIIANGEGEFTEELQAAFERAIEFKEIICPECWVKDNQSIVLTITDISDSTESYCCAKCDFDEELSKGD